MTSRWKSKNPHHFATRKCFILIGLGSICDSWFLLGARHFCGCQVFLLWLNLKSIIPTRPPKTTLSPIIMESGKWPCLKRWLFLELPIFHWTMGGRVLQFPHVLWAKVAKITWKSTKCGNLNLAVWYVFKYIKTSNLQRMTNCCFGAWWFGILRVPFSNNPFHRGIPGIPNDQPKQPINH